MANETKTIDMIMTTGKGAVTNETKVTIPVKSVVARGVTYRLGRTIIGEGKFIPPHCCDCDICGETGFRLGVACPYCNFICCKTCFDTYILTTTGDTKCMSCKAIFDLNTVWKLCITSVTYKKYLDFRLDQLIQKEKSLFQESLIQIEREKMTRKYGKLQYNLYKIQELLVEFQLKTIEMGNTDNDIAEMMLSSVGLNLRRVKRMRVREDMVHVSKKIEEMSSGAVESEELKQNTFIKHCSVADCKGTLNNKWNCRLCEACHCNKCGELKTENEESKANGTHVCDPNLVQNLEEIKKNSKPCPKCGVSIFKTEGCDQMFCIVCHTAFSWTTLKIETGRIHNPHYYEIMRKNGNFRREDGDVRPCDELVHHLEERHLMYDAISTELDIAQKSKFRDAPRFITELDSRDWNERTYTLDGETFSDIRKQFLKNEISDSDYRRRMKLKFNKFTKMHEVCQVLAVTKIAMSEELKHTIRNEDGGYMNIGDISVLRKKFQKYTTNIEDILKNTNEILYQLGLKYSSCYEIIIADNRYYRIVTKKI